MSVLGVVGPNRGVFCALTVFELELYAKRGVFLTFKLHVVLILRLGYILI